MHPYARRLCVHRKFRQLEKFCCLSVWNCKLKIAPKQSLFSYSRLCWKVVNYRSYCWSSIWLLRKLLSLSLLFFWLLFESDCLLSSVSLPQHQVIGPSVSLLHFSLFAVCLRSLCVAPNSPASSGMLCQCIQYVLVWMLHRMSHLALNYSCCSQILAFAPAKTSDSS